MATPELTLIGSWTSPFVLRPRIALNIKSLEYNFHQQQYGTKSELLLKSNPVHKKIPVLIHNGKPICESLIIVQYIDEAWPSSGPSIIPSDPYDRAMARFWSAYIDDKWFPTLRSVAMAADEEAKEDAIKQVVSGALLLEETFVASSKGKAFFGGDHIGLLDVALGCFLAWISVCELNFGFKIIDPEKTPKLAGWATTFRSDPAVVSIIPDTEKLAEHSKIVFAGLKKDQPAN